MRDSNLPKFLERDVPLFNGIIKDLFPGVDVPFVDYGKLQEAIEEQSRLASFVPVPAFVAKVIQIHETQTVRHGMMVVGQTGSGKSAAIHMLAAGLGSSSATASRTKCTASATSSRSTPNPSPRASSTASSTTSRASGATGSCPRWSGRRAATSTTAGASGPSSTGRRPPGSRT